MLRYVFGLMLGAMSLHTIWQALKARPLVIGYGHSHRITIASPKWYHRAFWSCVGLVSLMGAVLLMSGVQLF